MSCRYNFSAGPAILPKEVLEQVQSELIDWHGTGMSVIEMSHRGKQYLPILDEAENDLRNIFSIPKNYKVLFLQGGAITQNFMVPMNLLAGRSASYVASGYWSKRTYNDAQPFENIHLAASSESIDFIKAPDGSEWKHSSSDAYVHFCMNETIHGVEYFDVPENIKVPLVCDMSSNILSRPMDINKFGVIYAGAQKNIGPAGLTLLIVRDDLIDFADKKTPTTFNWKIQSDNKSMINTPSTFSIYVAGLIFKWIEKNGGLKVIEKKNIEKADYLYKYIDSSDFYYNNIDKNNRSRMNVPFRIYNDELTMKFVAEAEEHGLYQLKGHRLVGGLRASIYNAMPMEGVEALVEFMKIFEKNINEKNLNQIRQEIDKLDEHILKLVSERGNLAKEVGKLKSDGIIYKPDREASLIARLKKINQGPLSHQSVANIFKSIISNCRALEKKLSVAFLGPLGTFSEEATIKQFGENIDAIPTNSIDEVFTQVQSDIAHYGVVPVENSTEGAISRTLDLLLTKDLNICGEIILPVHHCLISKNKSLSQIKKVYAHGQSLAQCHDWIMNNLPNVDKIAVMSNADGAKHAAKEKNSAAIASIKAADLYKLNILHENIEDDSRNSTRFLVLSKQDIGISGNDKTSIVVATKNKPGAIADLVEPFAKNKVSMTKLESRPAKIGMWEYVFFIDLEGHLKDKKVKISLEQIESRASFIKVLGSYPASNDK